MSKPNIQKWREAMAYLWANPGPSFNPDYNPNWRKIQKKVLADLENMEFNSREERSTKYRELWDKYKKEFQ